MHFIYEVLYLVICNFQLHSLAANDGRRPLFLSRAESQNDERALVPSVDGEVQHDIIMYWSETFLGDSDVNLLLRGSNAQTERIHLHQSKRPSRFWRRAKAMVYRVMIKPVPGLSSVFVSSNDTVQVFSKILMVIDNDKVFEFRPSVLSKPSPTSTIPWKETSIEATLVYEYPAMSIRFTENGMCINPFFSVLPPPRFTRLVLRYNCLTLDAFFVITADDNIQHIASGLYVNVNKFAVVHPAPAGNNPLPVNGGSLSTGQSPSSNLADDNGRLTNTYDDGTDSQGELIDTSLGNRKLVGPDGALAPASSDTGHEIRPNVIYGNGRPGSNNGDDVPDWKPASKSHGDSMANEYKVLGHASRGKRLGGIHERLTPHLSGFPNRRLKDRLLHPPHDYLKDKKSQVKNQFVNLYLRPTADIKFLFTSDPKNYDETSDETLPQHARSLDNGNLPTHFQFGKAAKTSNKRALVTNLKSYLQENETGLCIGYQSKNVLLMPCESVPSSVQFYGKGGRKYASHNKEQLRKPITSAEIQNKTTPAEPAMTEETASVSSQCGASCPSSCSPSCAQSCCSSSSSNSGLCGSGCPSSCYPSCTSSCCDTDYQGMSWLASCPSACSNAQICPSTVCPLSCCSDAGQGGSYASQSGQGGSYASQSGQGGSSTICPSGCKKSCRASCPFNCC